MLLQELAELLTRRVKDPRLLGVTLTQVKVTADLRHARVFYSMRSGDAEGRAATAAGLESARGFLRRELGKRLRLRRIPDIVFAYDDSLDHGERIQQILLELQQAGDK